MVEGEGIEANDEDNKELNDRELDNLFDLINYPDDISDAWTFGDDNRPGSDIAGRSRQNPRRTTLPPELRQWYREVSREFGPCRARKLMMLSNDTYEAHVQYKREWSRRRREADPEGHRAHLNKINACRQAKGYMSKEFYNAARKDLADLRAVLDGRGLEKRDKEIKQIRERRQRLVNDQEAFERHKAHVRELDTRRREAIRAGTHVPIVRQSLDALEGNPKEARLNCRNNNQKQRRQADLERHREYDKVARQNRQKKLANDPALAERERARRREINRRHDENRKLRRKAQRDAKSQAAATNDDEDVASGFGGGGVS